jgi:hypothetical protein
VQWVDDDQHPSHGYSYYNGKADQRVPDCFEQPMEKAHILPSIILPSKKAAPAFSLLLKRLRHLREFFDIFWASATAKVVFAPIHEHRAALARPEIMGVLGFYNIPTFLASGSIG